MKTKAFTIHRAARVLAPLLACVCALLSSGFAPLAHALPVARFRNVRPTVQLRAGSAKTFAVVRERGAVQFGDVVKTGARGKADLMFSNGTQVAMRENSQIQIVPPASSESPLVIRVFGVFSEVFVRPRGRTQIKTAAAVAAARGTQYSVRVLENDQTVVTVSEGSVDFFNDSGTVLVTAGNQSTSDVGAAPTAPVAVDASGLVQWSADITGLPVEFETPFLSPDPAALIPLRAKREAAALAQPNSAKTQRELGEVLCDSGEYSSAIEAFQAALRLAPNDAASLLGMAQALRGQGDSVGAARASTRALQTLPDDAPLAGLARFNIALAQMAQGREEKARQALLGEAGKAGLTDVALRPHAGSAFDDAARGLISLHEGEPAAATDHLRAALRRDPKMYQAQALMALALLTQNKIEPASQAARAAVKLQPRSAQSQGALAMTLFFQNKIGDARRAANLAVELNPMSPFAQLTRGRVAMADGEVSQARDAYSQAQALAPDLPLVNNELGAVYLALNVNDKAEKAFRHAVYLNPNSADAFTGLGEVMLRKGNFDEALTDHRKAISLDPNNSSARSNLASLFIRQGDLENAARELEKAAQLDPSRGILFVRLSELSLLKQNLLPAADYAQRAVGLLPMSALANYQLGRVYLEMGRTSQAEERLRKAVELDGRLNEARFALGLVRQMADDNQDITRPATSLNASNAGSAGRAASLQNLYGSGADERIQAALADPTVARTASRAYGATEIESLAGGASTRTLRASNLTGSSNGRMLLGTNIAQVKTSGVLDNSTSDITRYGLTFGYKTPNDRAGLFALLQQETISEGLNRGDLDFNNGAREQLSKPTLLLGGNRKQGDNGLTRFLFQYTKPEISDRGFLFGATGDTSKKLSSFELRHDQRYGRKHLLSLGASRGKYSYNDSFFLPGLPGVFPDSQTFNTGDYSATDFYLRDEMRLNPRFKIIGELRKTDVSASRSFQVLPFLPVPNVTNIQLNSKFLPTFIASYQTGGRTSLRLRAGKRTQGFDNSLLHPTDEFASNTRDFLPIDIGATERRLELEAEHTFKNSSFLRLSLFNQRTDQAVIASLDGSGTLFGQGKMRGVRARYEGNLRRDLSFFTDFTMRRATDSSRQDVAFVPRFLGQIGLQYYNESGWFVQPSMYYQSGVFNSGLLTGEAPARRGGFGLFNLRVGRRLGLSTAAFVEVSNVGGKEYRLYDIAQPGRRLRFGLTQRF